ncbi:MAG: tyrosine-type recombinase/integrase [Chloroflexota bacterium]|nr:tyrosine-type recombinase/integrase [Chloroflexota bacterium]
MAKLVRTTISMKTVESLEVEHDSVFWDRDLPGFGVRVYPTGSKFYVAQTRAGGRPAKRVTLGRHGVITAEEARRRAARFIARVKSGGEPVAEPARKAGGPAVGELARAWLEEHVAVRCKPKTAQMYRLIVEKHILPALGRTPALAVDHKAAADLHHALRATPAMANQAVDVLSRIWNAAVERGRLPEAAANPCRLVARNPARRRERFLSAEEFRRLGRALTEAGTRKGVSVHAAAAIRLLVLTGCRKSEILALRWEDVDLAAGEFMLTDSKTGPRSVSLSPEAAEALANVPRLAGNPWVIPGRGLGERMRNLNDPWKVVRERAGLRGVRLHDLRHSFASRALALGESLPAIGKLLGHSKVETTARYAHPARDSVREAALKISESIAADLLARRPLQGPSTTLR